MVMNLKRLSAFSSFDVLLFTFFYVSYEDFRLTMAKLKYQKKIRGDADRLSAFPVWLLHSSGSASVPTWATVRQIRNHG